MKCIFSRRTNFALTLWKILLWWFWWKDLIWMLTITLISQGSGSLFTFLQNPILLWEVPYLTLLRAVWDNVFKNRSSKICGNQPLKSLPQVLLGPILNKLTQIRMRKGMKIILEGSSRSRPIKKMVSRNWRIKVRFFPRAKVKFI